MQSVGQAPEFWKHYLEERVSGEKTEERKVHSVQRSPCFSVQQSTQSLMFVIAKDGLGS